MTSKIALDKIINYYKDANKYEDIKYLFEGELNIIEKDLEKLDLIKKKINGILCEIDWKIYAAEMNGRSVYDLPLLRDTLLGFKNELENDN